MAYVNFDAESNHYDIIRGIYNPSREFREQQAAPDISILMEGRDVSGVRVRNIFERNEVLGAKGEDYIRGFLERNGIPFLFVGQGPTGTQRSEILKSALQAHRPDFLIHLPDLGTLFFDVKCRKRRSFNERGETCFYLFKSEMEALIKLHFNLFIPVWIAFLDSHSFMRSGQKPVLHLICASQLHSFWTEMKKRLTDRESQALGVIRIPMALFQPMREKLEFQIGLREIPDELAIRYAELHRGLVRRVQDEIRAFIRKNDALKTALPRQMLSTERLPFLLDADVKAAVQGMIQERIVRYEEGKPLRLEGE